MKIFDWTRARRSDFNFVLIMSFDALMRSRSICHREALGRTNRYSRYGRRARSNS